MKNEPNQPNEVALYLAAIQAIDAATSAKEREIYANNVLPTPVYPHEKAWEDTLARRNALVDGLYTASDRARSSLRSILRTSPDPLIAWIADNVNSDHDDELFAFLSALPLTRDQIDEFRAEKGWCHVYTDYIEAAVEAGVLPPA